MELGAKNHIEDGLLGPTSIMVVCVDPLGIGYILQQGLHVRSCEASREIVDNGVQE